MNDDTEPEALPVALPVEQLLVTVEQAAAMLAIGRTTVFRLIAEGDLEATKIGRATRVHVDALSDLVARLRARSQSDPEQPPISRRRPGAA